MSTKMVILMMNHFCVKHGSREFSAAVLLGLQGRFGAGLGGGGCPKPHALSPSALNALSPQALSPQARASGPGRRDSAAAVGRSHTRSPRASVARTPALGSFLGRKLGFRV